MTYAISRFARRLAQIRALSRLRFVAVAFVPLAVSADVGPLMLCVDELPDQTR